MPRQSGAAVAILSSPNVFTASQTLQGGVKVGTATSFQTETTISEIAQSAMVGTSTRPTLQHITGTPAPGSAPGVQTDYHGVDLILTTASANANANFSMYSLESNVQFTGTTTINRAVSIYGFGQNTGTGTITDVTNFQAEVQNTSSGTITTYRGFYVKPPINTGTITNLYGVHIDAITGFAAAANTYAIYSPSSAQSLFGGLISTSGGVNSQTSGSVPAGYFAQSGSTYGVQIVMTSAHPGLLINSNAVAAATAFAAQISGYDYGATVSTAANGGTTLSVQKTGTGSGTAMIINNAGSSTSLDLQTAGVSHVAFNANGDVNITNSSGWKIGTATTQKIGFFNATPVVQPSGTPAASTDLTSVIALANSLRTNLLALGLVA